MKAPLLVPTFTPFDFYVKSLSKHGRYEYRKAMKIGDSECFWIECDPTVSEVQKWMDFWTTQTVDGKHPKWRQWTAEKAIGLGTARMFVAGPLIAYGIQLLEVCGTYAYAWPVLYDKVAHPWFARFMWFKLIEWCCEHPDITYLDLGGGNGRNWRQVLADYRAGKDKNNYKWLYVPEWVKHGVPLEEIERWAVFVCPVCGWRTPGKGKCDRCQR